MSGLPQPVALSQRTGAPSAARRNGSSSLSQAVPRSLPSSSSSDAVRYSYTPDLGVFSAVTGANGDIVVPEGRLRAALALGAAGASALEAELQRLLGGAWDNELEPFRRAGDGAPVRWLNATG